MYLPIAIETLWPRLPGSHILSGRSGPPDTHDTESVSDECRIRETSVARRVGATDVVVAERRTLIDENAPSEIAREIDARCRELVCRLIENGLVRRIDAGGD